MSPTDDAFGTGPGLSGPELIENLCSRIAETLATDPDLRVCDSHERFSAIVSVQLLLHGVDQKRIEVAAAVGAPDCNGETRVVTLEIPSMSPSDVREQSGLGVPSLERATSPEAGQGQSTVAKRRFYAPRTTIR